MGISITKFGGIRPRIDPAELGPNSAQVAINAWLHNGSLQSFAGHSFVMTPTKSGTKKTIYRFGQTGANEALYWFSWTDDVDCVKGQIAADTDERTYFTGDTSFGHPRVTKASIALVGGTDYPMQSYRLGPPAPTAAPAGAVSGVGSGTTVDRAYVITHRTADGEESQPSPALVVTTEDGKTVTLSSFPSVPSGYNITTRLIYRTQEGNQTATDYQYVGSQPVGSTTFGDTITDANLDGTTLQSADWAPPPVSLRGIKNMSAGIMAGFDGNDVMFCVPYRPFAWPYRMPVAYPVVGLGVYGDTVVICTMGKPYIAVGTDPEQLIPRKLELEEACVSKRSIVETRMGVMYASPSGLVLVGPGGASLVTDALIDKAYWASLNPSSILGVENDGRYIGFYDNGTTQGGFVFDPTDTLEPFTLIDIYTTAAFNDVVRDSMYFISSGSIRKWEGATGSPLTYRWRSKDFSTSRMHYNIAVVQANAYPVTFRLYADLALKHTQTVTSEKGFRLPSGYGATTWSVEIEGTARVVGVFAASSSEEMKRLLAEP